ncbi:hypothetical protein, conserved [Eimeria necatrix]|uniref:Uncharacterized protein n=1 Tax=Eimeria necatrix TaxID=51315 RepID=U6MJ68_9EIME|nr:hypothetical protein, conserved [Eimeria necatrix]CDJ64051.1 hypothetical protein, conserved [Eimeria necatrix]
MTIRPPAGSADFRLIPHSGNPLPGPAGRASVSCKDLYSRSRARSVRRPPLSSTSCGWYEYGLYDVALALTEVPLSPYELEYRERTILTPEEPAPVELHSNRQPALVFKLKQNPRPCAPPHPSTVRVRYEPEAAPLYGHEEADQQRTEKKDKQAATQEKRENDALNSGAQRADEKAERGDKHEKSEKENKHEKTDHGDKTEKAEKHKDKKDKEKKKSHHDAAHSAQTKEDS